MGGEPRLEGGGHRIDIRSIIEVYMHVFMGIGIGIPC